MQELAENNNTFLQSMSTDFTPITPGDTFHISPDCTVTDRFIIFVEDTERMLLSLDTSKTCCPDGIPTCVLSEYASLLCGRVYCIFNSSLRDSFVPEEWKAADVVPIPQVPSPSLIESHLQPVALTAVLCRLLERFVTQWVMEYLQDTIDPHQFGSLKGSSTTHALVEMIHQW